MYVRLPEDCKTVKPFRSHFTGAAFIERMTISRKNGLIGKEVQIEGLAAMMTDVIVRLEHINGAVQIERLTPQKPFFTVLTVPSSYQVAKTYTSLGIEHIWEGIDHLLFVLCLVLVTGINRKLFWTITGFTIAHSVTLALSTLNFINIPIAPVEVCIALSVVFLASEIARGSKDTLSFRYPMAVSILFGLLHGFGFASVLRDIGLPDTDLAVSLLFFNLGVEIGQLLFIAAVIGVLFVIRLGYSKFMSKDEETNSVNNKCRVLVSYIIGITATFWMIDRISSF